MIDCAFKAVLIVLLSFFTNGSVADVEYPVNREVIEFSKKKVLVNGEYFKSAVIAYDHFTKSRYFTSVENYVVEISEEDDGYHVFIIMPLTRRLAGIVSGAYVVDKQSFSIVSFNGVSMKDIEDYKEKWERNRKDDSE